MSKRLLVAISHAIERFALAAADDQPTLVIAMFQRLSYFQREVEMYRRIAATNAMTVVGLVEDLPPALPPGIDHVLLDESDDLAREWSVTVLSPRSGACLVATDTETVFEDARTLEAGRRFQGAWSFQREDAYREALRLRRHMDARGYTSLGRRMDEVLRAVVSASDDRSEPRTEASLRFVAREMDRAFSNAARLHNQLDAHTETMERDRHTGVGNRGFLRRWTAGSASGTLPVGVLGLRLEEAIGLRNQYGRRAELAALQTMGEQLRYSLGKVDKAVRLGDGDFVILLPAKRIDDVLRCHQQIVGGLAGAVNQFPFVPLHVSAAAMVSRDRPLPIDAVMGAVNQADEDHQPAVLSA